MELQDFTEQAIKTESLIDHVEFNYEMLGAAFEAFIASATVLDMFKKNIFYGKPIDIDRMHAMSNTLTASTTTLTRRDYQRDQRILININPRLFHSIIGICTESGELGELAMKAIESGEFDNVNFGEELGDIDWYKAIGTDEADLDPNNILNTVIKKLQKRYPDKFTSDDAINRDVGSERELLENNLT